MISLLVRELYKIAEGNQGQNANIFTLLPS